MSFRMIALLGGTALVAVAAVVLIYETRDDGALRPATPSSAPAAIASPRSPAAPVLAPALPAAPSPAADPAAPAAEPVVTTTDIDEATGSGLAVLADAMAQHHWPDAAAACKNSQVAQVGAASCTLAACQMHDGIRARMYFGAVGSDGREAVMSTCAELHVPVDRPVPHMPFRSRFRHGG
jgi:hypothetical protein